MVNRVLTGSVASLYGVLLGGSSTAYVYSEDDNVNFRYKETTGSENWANIRDIVSGLNDLRSSFQDGCNSIQHACSQNGVTPASNSPADISSAINQIASNKYNAGYNAGRNNPINAGTYKISFSGRMHPPGDGSNWIDVSDVIYIKVTGSGVSIDTGYISLGNGQVDLNVSKV